MSQHYAFVCSFFGSCHLLISLVKLLIFLHKFKINQDTIAQHLFQHLQALLIVFQLHFQGTGQLFISFNLYVIGCHFHAYL